MPSPGLADVHVNRPLTTISQALLQQEKDFVALRAMPIIKVQSKSDQYFKYDEYDFNRDSFTMRAPGAETGVTSFGLSTDTYNCVVWSNAFDVEAQIAANADAPLNLEQDATKMLTNQYLVHLEGWWCSEFFQTGQWTGQADDASWNWSVSTNDPVKDIGSKVNALQYTTGHRANTAVFGSAAMQMFLDHPLVIDRIKYTQTGVVAEDLVASILGLDEVFTTRGIKTTSDEGATGAISSIGSINDVAIYYKPKSPGLMTPSAGYQFVWDRYLGGGAGQRIYRTDIPLKRATRIEMECAYVFKMTNSKAGCFAYNVTA
tara:strand:+ start:5969 stop:6919 length:951 start_codon:yes stop_codon:yes gene_type:complete